MSGHKRAMINITQDEYDRLRASDVEMRTMTRELDELQQQLAKTTSTEMKRFSQQNEDRKGDYDRLLTSFDQQVRAVEIKTQRLLAEKEVDLIKAVNTSAGSLWQASQSDLFEQLQAVQIKVEQEHHAQQLSLLRLQRQNAHITNQQNQKIGFAQSWIDQAAQLFEHIRIQYRHELFSPGRLDRIYQELSQAADNLEQGMAEAALLGCQQSFQQLSELRVYLENQESLWQCCYSAAREGLQTVLTIALQNQSVAAVDPEGNLLPNQIQVDYWTQGALANIVSTIETDIATLTDEKDSLPLDQLETLLRHDLPELNQSIEDLVFNARMTALNSQLRINIADLILESLASQGYELVGAQYAAQDMRKMYTAQVRNLAGGEIVIQVVPDSERLGQNEFHLISLDRERIYRREMLAATNEISVALEQRGLEVGNIEEVGNYGRRKQPVLSEQMIAENQKSQYKTR